jgi:site-specific recombinase XerD
MADMAYLKGGSVRVRYSYGGPLKEDKGSTGKMKWAPAAADAVEFLGMWLKRRKLQGAKDEDLVFPAPPAPNSKRRGIWTGYRKEHIEDCWAEAAKACKVTLTWYQATRHSFVTRNLEAGASLDEVSAAIGHSSPVVTKRFYDHHVRKSFSDILTARLPTK